MEPKKKGRRFFIPPFIPLDKKVIKTVNDFDGDRHMRAIRKPGDDKVYLYVSPLFYIAIMDFKRGRYSQTTYAKKSEFTKFMDNKIPAQTRSHIKKYIQPRTKSIMGMDMHLVDLPHMTDKGGHYDMPYGDNRPEGKSLNTALFENKNTIKISTLRAIIKEEIASRLEVINETIDFYSADIEWEYVQKLDESTYVVGTDGKGKFYEGYAVYHLGELQDVDDIEEISEADYNEAVGIN